MATATEIAEIEAAIAEAIKGGLSSVTVDGTTTSFADANARLEALRGLANRVGQNDAGNLASFGLRHSQLVPPGTG